MTADVIGMRVHAGTRLRLNRVRQWCSATPTSTSTPGDPDDVLARLVARPTFVTVATGTPIDDLAADRTGRGSVATIEGESESNKTGMLLVAVATRIRAGDEVVLHLADRSGEVTARRLAKLLGVEPETLGPTFPRLHVLDGPLAKSLALVAPGSTFALDSVQAARTAVVCRSEAADHERVNVVLKMLRQAAKRDALVLATVETKNGQPRFSVSTSFDADVRLRASADGLGRFGLEAVKPRRSGVRWYALDPRGRPVDRTATAIASFVDHKPKPQPSGRRRADNKPARTAEQIGHDVLGHVRGHDGCSAEAVARAVRGRRERVLEVVRRLVQGGELQRDESGGLHVE